MTRAQSEQRAAQARREQEQVLGFEFPETTAAPLTILGIVPWRELWSMGVGAGASAFTRSPVALAARGHRMHIAQPCGRGQAREMTFAGVRFHRFRSPEAFSNPDRPLPVRLASRAWRYGVFQVIARRAALRLAAELRPDLILAYGIMTAPAARGLARRLQLPLVGRYFGNTLSLALENQLRWMGNFMERIGFRVPVEAMILTNDGSPALEILRRLQVDLRPVHFLRNGLALDVFTPGPRPSGRLAELGLPEDAFVLLTATRLHSEKRLDRTLHALAALRREVPQAVAILLGDGPERASLEALAERLGIRDAVRFPGPALNVELPDWYRLADVVLSLLDRTNASNPVFEAMACERCVVALDVGTTAEVVRGGLTGVLVPPERIEELPVVLAELARDPGRREALGRAARALVAELCGTWEQRMLREVGVIEEVARTRDVVPGNLVDAAVPPGAVPAGARPEGERPPAGRS